MKRVLSVLLIGLFLATPIFAKDKVKEFNFETTVIEGSTTKPTGVMVDSIKNSDNKTKINSRKNFLNSLSSSIDNL